jgi:hypothetical protein
MFRRLRELVSAYPWTAFAVLYGAACTVVVLFAVLWRTDPEAPPLPPAVPSAAIEEAQHKASAEVYEQQAQEAAERAEEHERAAEPRPIPSDPTNLKEMSDAELADYFNRLLCR